MSTSTVEKAPDDAFCNLEVLKLRFMHSLGTFHKLKVLSVRNSYKLIELITRDLLGRLQNLEQLRPKFCFNLKTIIQLEGDYDTAGEDIRTQSPNLPPSPAFLHLKCLIIQYCYTLKCLVPMKVKDGGGRYKVTQPLFKFIHLGFLPNLWRFSERDSFVVSWPSLEHITVKDCVHLRRLPLDTNSVPKLKQFDIDLKWFKRLECADDRIKTRLFQTFFPGMLNVVMLRGTLRCLTTNGLHRLRWRLKEVVTKQASVHRCKAIIDMKEKERPVYPAVMNDETLHEHVEMVGRHLLSSENVKLCNKVLASEDFAFYQEVIPGVMFSIGIINEELGSVHSPHSPYFFLDEDVLPIGAAVHTALAEISDFHVEI